MSWEKMDGTSWQCRISFSGEINVNAPLHWKGAEVLELVCGPFGDKAGMNLLFIKSLAVVVNWKLTMFTSKQKGSVLFFDTYVYILL